MELSKKPFVQMRDEMTRYDADREVLIKTSRDALKHSKAAIYSMQRNEFSDAKKHLDAAKAVIKNLDKILKKDAHHCQTGAYGDALEEYVEASTMYGVLHDGKLPTAKDLGVDTDTYLPGLCDLVGELVRKAINASIAGDYALALKIRHFVSDLYNELMIFDFRNVPVRKKFDAIKYGLEKLENLVLELKLKGKI